MIKIYSPAEIALAAKSGQITASALKTVLENATPGITTKELDKIAEKEILAAGAEPSFKMEKGYFHATCLCVNDCVVHGIPTDYRLRENDRLGVDIGAYYQGFHGDASWSIVVGKKSDSKAAEFLQAGQEALRLAVAAAVPGNHIGNISAAIQKTIESAGYSPVKQLVGHGVGRILHEDPEIPCYIRGRVKNTPLIKPGMILAVEVIYNQGTSPVVYSNDDGWTIVTRDGKLSGLFEHTVAVTETGPRILTLAN